MTRVDFRPLEENDETTVRSWLGEYLRDHRNWWSAAYGRGPANSLEELVDRDWNDLWEANASAGSFVRVATDPAPAGVVYARKQPERFMGFEIGVLSWIYVDARARGRGIAGALMARAGQWMTEQGVAGRLVYVTAANETAVKLYERHGYLVADYRMLGQVE